jgi:hypothetical protein
MDLNFHGHDGDYGGYDLGTCVEELREDVQILGTAGLRGGVLKSEPVSY